MQRALAAGTEAGLRVLGYGEITLVIGWPTDQPAFACKRLPQFHDRATCDRYLATIADYLDVLRARGIDVVETDLLAVDTDGGVAGYAVQPVLDAATLGPAVLRGGRSRRRATRSSARRSTPRSRCSTPKSGWTRSCRTGSGTTGGFATST